MWITQISCWLMGCKFYEPKWNDKLRCYGKTCVYCGRMKQHPWFGERKVR